MAPPQQEFQYGLLGEIIHSLKGPLSAAKSFADLIAEEGGLNERQEKYVQRIITATLRTTDTINELLDLVWIEEGMDLHSQPCNIIAIIENVIAKYEGQAEDKQITITVRTDEPLPRIDGDERRIYQVLDNFLSNALKYNKIGGSITIIVKFDDEIMRVSVKDTGIGIEDKDMPHVFDRFYRASNAVREVEGSGIGLAIARAIIAGHNGEIGATSEIGCGSTFWFTLPLSQPAPDEGEPHHARLP